MRQLLRCLVIFSLLAVPASGFADGLFYLSGTLQGGGTASGNISVANGNVGTVNVTILDHGITYLYNHGVFFEQPYPGLTPPEFYSVSYDPAGDLLLLVFPTLLTGYNGGVLCSASRTCTGFPSSTFTIGTGTSAVIENFATLNASAVPEPGTLGLMLTGALGVAGTMRRRFAGR